MLCSEEGLEMAVLRTPSAARIKRASCIANVLHAAAAAEMRRLSSRRSFVRGGAPASHSAHAGLSS
jgi:hypothetical protein